MPLPHRFLTGALTAAHVHQLFLSTSRRSIGTGCRRLQDGATDIAQLLNGSHNRRQYSVRVKRKVSAGASASSKGSKESHRQQKQQEYNSKTSQVKGKVPTIEKPIESELVCHQCPFYHVSNSHIDALSIAHRFGGTARRAS